MNTREITTTGSKIVYKNRWMQVREDSIVVQMEKREFMVLWRNRIMHS